MTLNDINIKDGVKLVIKNQKGLTMGFDSLTGEEKIISLHNQIEFDNEIIVRMVTFITIEK